MVLAQPRHTDQCNRVGSPEINSDTKKKKKEKKKNSDTYGQLIYDKGGKNTPWRNDNLFSKWCWEHWIASCERMKLEHFLIPHAEETQNGLNT